jgi:hypothetical protein
MRMEPQSQLRHRMAKDLRSFREMGMWPLVLRLAAVGAFAGFAAWVVVWIASPLFEFDRPTAIALVLAVPRGAIFGTVFALILRVYWNRSQGRHDSKEGL